MNFPKEVTVTDQCVDISNFSSFEKDFVVKIAKDIVDEYFQSGDSRRIVGIAGPSGAGKSLLSVLVQAVAKEHYPHIPIYPISIDAFHFHNDYLESHHAVGGTLKSVKGRNDTYDVAALEVMLKKFTDLEALSLPEYSRKLHEPISDVISIPEGPGILLIEGLWLLCEDYGWENIHHHLSRTYFLHDSKSTLREHTIKRHIAGGKSEREAAEQYDQNDRRNAELVMKTKNKADEELVWP